LFHQTHFQTENDINFDWESTTHVHSISVFISHYVPCHVVIPLTLMDCRWIVSVSPCPVVF
jgi:hypothetical protein